MKTIKQGSVKKTMANVYRSDTTPPKGPGKSSKAGMTPKMAGNKKCAY